MTKTQLVLTVVLSTLLVCPVWAKEPSPVGVVIPLTGPLAEVGLGIRNAMTMAQRERDPKGAVRFIFEDNQYEAKSTVAAVQKLIARDKVRGLLVFGANPALAIADIVEQAKVPTIAISTSKEVVGARKFVMRHHLNAETEGALLADEMMRRGYGAIAMITTQNDGVLTVRDDLIKRLKGKIVLETETAPSEREFSALASRIKRSESDAALLCMMPPQVGILAKRLKEIGYQGAVVGCHPLEVDPESFTPGGSLIGSWFVSTDERPAAEFFRRYQEEFGTKAPIVATNGYDIAALFIAALRTDDPNQYLHSVTDFAGALGSYRAGPDSSFDFPAAVRLVTPEGIVYQ